jgi:hypothetical protein
MTVSLAAKRAQIVRAGHWLHATGCENGLEIDTDVASDRDSEQFCRF